MTDGAAGRPPLALILANADPTRLRAALVLARCEIALGGSARLFLQGEAVTLLRAPIVAPRDEAWYAAGEPPLAVLITEALEDGVLLSACQSGLAMAGMTATDLPPGVVPSGPIAFLAAVRAETRLLMA